MWPYLRWTTERGSDDRVPIKWFTPFSDALNKDCRYCLLKRTIRTKPIILALVAVHHIYTQSEIIFPYGKVGIAIVLFLVAEIVLP